MSKIPACGICHKNQIKKLIAKDARREETEKPCSLFSLCFPYVICKFCGKKVPLQFCMMLYHLVIGKEKDELMQSKRFLWSVIPFLFLISLTVWAQIPMPARIGGTLTVGDTQITHENDASYTFFVTQTDGTPFEPVAEDTDGLNDFDSYQINIPLYDENEQPGGAKPGSTAIIHVYDGETELSLVSPAGGQFTIGASGGTISIDLVTVMQANQPPVAHAGPDQTVSGETEAMLDGSDSSDPDGDDLEYKWKQISGPSVTLFGDTGVQSSFYTPSVGPEGAILTFELNVSDSSGSTSADQVRVTVLYEGQPPVADAGPDQTVTEGDTVTLDGTSSADSDGQIVAYQWIQVSGTAMTLSDATVTRPAFTASNGDLDGETLTFELLVRDNSGLTDTDQVSVTVFHENQPPVADAGPDQTVEEGDLVTLDGSNSSDADGQIVSYFWKQAEGTSVTLSDQASVTSFFTAANGHLGGEALVFELTVSDNQGLQHTDRVIVNITTPENQPPVADAGPDQTVMEGDMVTLNGSNSADPDGQIASYFWTQISGTPLMLSDAFARNPVFIASNGHLGGEALVFELTVSDAQGLQHTDRVTVNIAYENQPPVADAGPDQTVKEGDVVTLDGSDSADPDGQITSYLWRQTSGPSVTFSDPTAIRPRFTAPQVGSEGISLTFDLTVTDKGTLQAQDSVTINVTYENRSPVADAGPDQTVGEGETVTLDGSGSSDPDDGIATYFWNQSFGMMVTLSDPSEIRPTFLAPHVGGNNGVFIFKLTVTDAGGLRNADQVTVSVGTANQPPVADPGNARTVEEGSTVILDGGDSYDADGEIAAYQWRQTGGSPVTLSDKTVPSPTFVPPPVGADGTALIFELSVTDDGGLQHSDEIRITVHDNGITRFPNEVIPFSSSTGRDMGVRVSAGHLISLHTLHPDTTTHVTGKPVAMPYGLTDLEILTDHPGDAVSVVFYLSEPVPANDKWYIYDSHDGWHDLSAQAVFSADRTRVTLTLADGGIGDTDGIANQVIESVSGPGTSESEPSTPAETSEGGAGDTSGGCFIMTIAGHE